MLANFPVGVSLPPQEDRENIDPRDVAAARAVLELIYLYEMVRCLSH